MTNEVKIEAKLGFDKLRGSVAARCSTGYGRERAEGEMVSIEPAEIERRLGLADEMRVILMFEPGFPNSGFGDCIPFLVPALWMPCAGFCHFSAAVRRGSIRC